MNYSIYLFPKLIHMYYVCYLTPSSQELDIG